MSLHDRRGWHYRLWLTRERMFCKACWHERHVWVQLAGSLLMGDAPRAQWRFNRTYWARARQAVKRHFAAEHPAIPIR